MLVAVSELILGMYQNEFSGAGQPGLLPVHHIENLIISLFFFFFTLWHGILNLLIMFHWSFFFFGYVWMTSKCWDATLSLLQVLFIYRLHMVFSSPRHLMAAGGCIVVLEIVYKMNFSLPGFVICSVILGFGKYNLFLLSVNLIATSRRILVPLTFVLFLLSEDNQGFVYSMEQYFFFPIKSCNS